MALKKDNICSCASFFAETGVVQVCGYRADELVSSVHLHVSVKSERCPLVEIYSQGLAFKLVSRDQMKDKHKLSSLLQSMS